jgi:two-component system response regulator GlrR
VSQLPTVLVVDDDTDLLQLLTLRLQRAGFAVQTATGGAEALKRLADRQPQAVITDLRMDGLDGLELLTEIGSRYPVLPVVLMTAHGTIPDAVKATRRGAYAFLTKPIDDSELVACLRQATALHGGQASDRAAQTARDRGSSAQHQDRSLLRQAELAAPGRAASHPESASGTGKVAGACDTQQARATATFVTVKFQIRNRCLKAKYSVMGARSRCAPRTARGCFAGPCRNAVPRRVSDMPLADRSSCCAAAAAVRSTGRREHGPSG